MDGSKYREVIRTLLLEEIARVVQTREDPEREAERLHAACPDAGFSVSQLEEQILRALASVPAVHAW